MMTRIPLVFIFIAFALTLMTQFANAAFLNLATEALGEGSNLVLRTHDPSCHKFCRILHRHKFGSCAITTFPCLDLRWILHPEPRNRSAARV